MAVLWILAFLDMGLVQALMIPPFIWSWVTVPRAGGTAMLEEQARLLECRLESINKLLEE